MARIDNLTNFLTDVATSIKEKTGDNTLIPASQFDTKILGIQTGKLTNEQYVKANNNLDEILYQSQNVLPNTYQEVEYIESIGTQCIDTNLPVTVDLRLEIDFKLNSTGASRYIMGQYAANYGSFYMYQQGNLFQTAYGCTYSNTTKTVDTDRHYWKFYIENGQTKVECDNEVVLSKAILSNIEQIYICIAGSAHTKALSIRTYGAKMYKNNVLVRNFIPAKRNSDNVLGMYDTVNNVFYTNEGTGDFVVGADVDVLNRKIEKILNEKIMKIRPENIKSGVEILGVVGTYTGN